MQPLRELEAVLVAEVDVDERTSGRSSVTSRIAAALSEATPTTSSPSRVSRSTAPSRKRALSSTMTHLTGTL